MTGDLSEGQMKRELRRAGWWRLRLSGAWVPAGFTPRRFPHLQFGDVVTAYHFHLGDVANPGRRRQRMRETLTDFGWKRLANSEVERWVPPGYTARNMRNTRKRDLEDAYRAFVSRRIRGDCR